MVDFLFEPRASGHLFPIVEYVFNDDQNDVVEKWLKAFMERSKEVREFRIFRKFE